ncbi:MAG: FAD-dependent oxidoreductase [Clostridia bacterium]|nr:FAD-dependent oxidoreductase [Clostridia bacterium]
MDKRLVIIGSGPAGLVCALNALKGDVRAEDILIIEREEELGGTLNLCIHTGFGKGNKTGTELATQLADKVKSSGINYLVNTTVISFDKNKEITVVSPQIGYEKIKAEAIVLATGCRERSRGGLSIGGTRPSGVMSAGTAQRFVNLEGYLPGKRTIVVGSTDLAVVIARRLTLEGGNVLCVCDRRSKPQVDKADISECLDFFNIPLKLRTTVTRLFGKERLEAVELADLDKNGKTIRSTRRILECDSLIYSCGFIPENEVAFSAGVEMKRATRGPVTSRKLETNIEGVFSCGNARYIHSDVVDVMTDGKKAGKFVADYLRDLAKKKRTQGEQV